MRYVRMGLLIAVAAAACFWLARAVGPWAAVGVWAVVMGAGCAAAAGLLRTSEIGRVTWKNYVAGYFLPWGFLFGQGQLWRIAAGAWVGWVLIAVATVLVAGPAASAPSAVVAAPGGGGNAALVRALVLASWFVDGAALLYVVSRVTQTGVPGSSARTSVLKVVAFLAVILVGSVSLWLTGHPRLALLVGGGPPAVIGGLFLAFMGGLMLFGRNLRWN